MPANCTLTLSKEKLPLIISKVEFFMFRAMEHDNIDVFEMTGPNKSRNVMKLLDTVEKTILPNYIKDYTEKVKELRLENNNEEADEFQRVVDNYMNMQALWSKIWPNFIKFSTVFETRNKFLTGEDGLVDLTSAGDDEAAVKKMVFDKPSNEIDPIDDVDKTVELFLRSLPDEDVFDDYGYTSSVNYSNFLRNLFVHVENSTSLDEIIRKMEKYTSEAPGYKTIIDKLKHKENHTKLETQFRINFRNSFVKAFMPIYQMSLEDKGIIKTFEAATGKVSGYQRKIESNFYRVGIPVELPDGTVVNIADEKDGAWELNGNGIKRIMDLFSGANADMATLRQRQLAFIKALGFEFSPKTEQYILSSNFLGPNKDGNVTGFHYLKEHLLNVLANLKQGQVITNPIRAISNDLKRWNKVTEKLDMVSPGQSNAIKNLIKVEMRYNKTYNMDRNVITPDGNRMHALQLHNNFSVTNKMLSDPITYPDLQTILDKEPSMFFLDPEKNPAIRSSMIMNSLFYFDPKGENYGKRRRVVKQNDKPVRFSATEGEFVKVDIVNTGGLQIKTEDETKGASSTDLNDLDKLFQDINSFRQIGYNSVLRLGDKSTDLGMMLNYYHDPLTQVPQKRPLEFYQAADAKIFSNDGFTSKVTAHLQDYLQMKYLAKKGNFLQDLSMSSENILNTWGYFEDLITTDIKKELDGLIDNASSVDQLTLDPASQLGKKIKTSLVKEMEDYAGRFINRIKPAYRINPYGLIKINPKAETFDGAIKNYLANSFLMDLDQMKVFFGDPIFFKDFHKRSPKDSATGMFTFVDDNILSDLNNEGNAKGYGPNTNLSGKRLAERLYLKGYLTNEEYKQALARQQVDRGYKSAVLKDVTFDSVYKDRILANIEKLKEADYVTPAMQKLYEEQLKSVISKEYKGGNEADGQGKCTFDFYRIMSILTSQWSDEQEAVYKKIVDYSHYDELAEAEKDLRVRADLIQKRDAVGYNPLEEVYFPPKKFQYAGTMKYEKTIQGSEYATMVPVFDKFSLQPLIPTITKGTADEHLAKRMEFSGVGYVKFESGSKVETPKDKDEVYVGYDQSKPEQRNINPFLSMGRSEINGLTVAEKKDLLDSLKFKSENTLFFSHLKEQVSIDADVHDSAVFGSQIRKLIMMNMELAEFSQYYDDYVKYIGELVEIEKAHLYNELGIERNGKNLKVQNLQKLVEYFLEEISKKNQDSNVKRALNYDETTGKFDIPLDAAVQAQVIEGIIISAINNNIVRYKANGSMLTQVAITGSERVNFNKKASGRALETFGNTELKYYDIEGEGKDAKVTAMQVKVGMTKNWLPLLNLKHKDGKSIDSLPRMNEMLRDEAWRKENSEKIQMVGYRIPTQGKNFLDVMEIVEFLPAQFGDAIIMPSEVVIKSGSDFDIDKMFILYPSLNESTGEPYNSNYTAEELKDPKKYYEHKRVVQNRLQDVMRNVILHPANYLELVTPSTNYEIMPIVNDIYKKVYEQSRKKTDYKNTEILDREKNIKKFLSLLKGKSDLGIAAVANTFNVLFQHAKAKGNPQFFNGQGSRASVRTLFRNQFIAVDEKTSIPTDVDFSGIYDEVGNLKSEFYSEFINAFVDVAKDDYVFAVNVVTELSPLMFYMKYMGMSSKKIMYFVNQPVIRKYISKLSLYQNKFLTVKLGDETARRRALRETLEELGYPAGLENNRTDIYDYLEVQTRKQNLDLKEQFEEKALFSNIRSEKDGLSGLTYNEKLTQMSYLNELLNLKVQTDSMTEIQRALNFDTKSFASGFDVYARNQVYIDGKASKHVLSAESIEAIKKNSIISPLDVSTDIAFMLKELLPVRNDIKFNMLLLKAGTALVKNRSLTGQDALLKYARTAKNDLGNYVLQNHFQKSSEGVKFFKENWETNLSLNDYLKELVESNKLVDQFNELKKQPWYEDLENSYPFVRNLIFERGEKNPKIITFKFLENSSNPIEKESVIHQFETLANLEDPRFKLVRDFFRNLSLYSIFQGGFNTGMNSFTNIAPQMLINPLYGYAVAEFVKLSDSAKMDQYETFYRLFEDNNPGFFERASNATLTRDIASRGKWYVRQPALDWAKPAQKPATPALKSASPIGADKPKGEMVKEGVYVNQGALSKDEQLELFNYLKPYLEDQAAKTNKGAQASKMIGLGLRWDYKSNNPGKQALSIPDVINPGNIDKYGYYNTSINNKPLAPITPRFRELIQKATGIDMTNYDGAIINLYDNDSFISTHNDVDESRSAINYPVVGVNLGGTGNFSIESRDGSPKQLNLKSGTAYVFGVNGVNRDVFHRTFPGKQDSFLPALTTKIDGKTYEAGSYRVTITMRRVMPLQSEKSKPPAIKTTMITDAIGHSGGANGADLTWDAEGKPYGVTFKHYYTGVKSDKNAPGGTVDISNFPVATEGASKVAQAAKVMWGYKYNTMKDERLIRNWAQVVKSEAIFAVAPIGKQGDVWSEDKGKTDPRTVIKSEIVQGGTGYAVEMAIQAGKRVYVYNDPNAKADSHLPRGWYTWNGSKFEAIEAPTLTKNFAGIGSRNISDEAKQAIREVYAKTFGNKKQAAPIVTPTESTTNPKDQVLSFFKAIPGYTMAFSAEQYLSMYNKEALEGESLEEFLKRRFCKQ